MVAEAMSLVRNLRHLAVSDPEIMGCEPMFRGTRIPVAMIADLLAAGESVEAIRGEYPSLTAQQIELAPKWVQTYPARDRPAAKPWRARRPQRRTRVALRAHEPGRR